MASAIILVSILFSVLIGKSQLHIIFKIILRVILVIACAFLGLFIVLIIDPEASPEKAIGRGLNYGLFFSLFGMLLARKFYNTKLKKKPRINPKGFDPIRPAGSRA